MWPVLPFSSCSLTVTSPAGGAAVRRGTRSDHGAWPDARGVHPGGHRRGGDAGVCARFAPPHHPPPTAGGRARPRGRPRPARARADSAFRLLGRAASNTWTSRDPSHGVHVGLACCRMLVFAPDSRRRITRRLPLVDVRVPGAGPVPPGS